MHHGRVVVDCHNDLILSVARKREMGVPDYFGRYWLPELRAGGVDVQVAPIHVEHDFQRESALRRTLLLNAWLRQEIERQPEDCALCLDGQDIERATGAGKIAFIMALESCDGIGADVDLFDTFYRLGFRMAS